MRCDETREDLIGLIYDEIDDDARGRIEAHLAGCAGCRDERERMGETSALLRLRLGDQSCRPPGGTVISYPIVRVASASAWRRAAVAAAVITGVSLLSLSVANARIRRDTSGWSLQLSLLPSRGHDATIPDETIDRLIDERLRPTLAALDDQLERTRASLMVAMDRRIEDERRQTLDGLARALARQEQFLSAGLHTDKEELMRRDRAVEEMLGSEINRTRQMLGVVLASTEPRVIEQ